MVVGSNSSYAGNFHPRWQKKIYKPSSVRVGDSYGPKTFDQGWMLFLLRRSGQVVSATSRPGNFP